jgi:hypothetical protein
VHALRVNGGAHDNAKTAAQLTEVASAASQLSESGPSANQVRSFLSWLPWNPQEGYLDFAYAEVRRNLRHDWLG